MESITFLPSYEYNFLQVLKEHQNDYKQAVDFLVSKFKLSFSKKTIEEIATAVHQQFFHELVLTPGLYGLSHAMDYLKAHNQDVHEQVVEFAREHKFGHSPAIRSVVPSAHSDLLPTINEAVVQHI